MPINKQRRILLIEPNYKNKYPPMGLMKLSTYHKLRGDYVQFYKGTFSDFVINEIYEELVIKLKNNDSNVNWKDYSNDIKKFISRGLSKEYKLLLDLSNQPLVKENLKYYRNYYYHKKYLNNPKWDRICITTLFTFYWDITIKTINDFKNLCKDINEVKVGGIAASLVPEYMENATGIKPFIGLLNTGGEYDKDDDTIIDHLPLDYSILNEIDYKYPENSGYYGYMTRGCINKCAFCAVPTIEPHYNEFISIKEQIKYVDEHFGKKRNLLLLDNNVLASESFDEIIDEIKDCGFDKKTMYYEPNPYLITVKALREGINDKGYIKNTISLYKELISKTNGKEQDEIINIIVDNNLLDSETATKEAILDNDRYFKPLFENLYKSRCSRSKARYVDFNQGVDARLITPEKMKKLSEIPIKPLRIAFDSWALKDTYEKAVRIAVNNGIKNMSNYLLYNFHDEPIDLYNRLQLNVNLCEELDVNIYSFPMKYHPIKDPSYFSNRNFLGEHWNRKFIRTIQAILNSTKGKIGKGKAFFEAAFGHNADEFKKILYMPEAMIIYREYFKKNGIVYEWEQAFNSLSENQRKIALPIIHKNKFNNYKIPVEDKAVLRLLKYYQITRNDVNMKKY